MVLRMSDNGGSKIFEGGVEDNLSALSSSQMHTMNHMPFTQKKAAF